MATDASEGLELDVAVALEDHLALQMACMQTKAMQADKGRRMAVTVLIAAVCAPLALAGGTLIAWTGDRDRPSLGSALHAALLDDPGTMGLAVLWMVVGVFCCATLQRRLVRPRLRRLLRQVLMARPDVDPADPRLAYLAHVTVGDEGLESRSGAGMSLVHWGALQRWNEKDGRFMVLGEAMVGFCVSFPAADEETRKQLRAILTKRLGPKDETLKLR